MSGTFQISARPFADQRPLVFRSVRGRFQISVRPFADQCLALFRLVLGRLQISVRPFSAQFTAGLSPVPDRFEISVRPSSGRYSAVFCGLLWRQITRIITEDFRYGLYFPNYSVLLGVVYYKQSNHMLRWVFRLTISALSINLCITWLAFLDNIYCINIGIIKNDLLIFESCVSLPWPTTSSGWKLLVV